jgi:hypothetical protein
VTEKEGARGPIWSTDEIILALDFYMKHRPSIPSKTDPSIEALSDDLRALGPPRTHATCPGRGESGEMR